MNGTKSLLASKTFWGGMLLVLSFVLSQLGYTLTSDDQATLIDAILQCVTALSALLGTGFTIYGRAKASKTIGSIAPMLALLLILPTSGCNAFSHAPTPLTSVVILRDSYAATLQILTTYRAIGQISDAEALDIEAVRIVAAAALDDYETAAHEGAPDAVLQTHLATLNTALDRLIAWRIELETSHDRTGNPGADASDRGTAGVPRAFVRDVASRGWPRPDAGRSGPGQGATTQGRDRVERLATPRNTHPRNLEPRTPNPEPRAANPDVVNAFRLLPRAAYC